MERRHFIRKTAISLVSATGVLAVLGYLRQFFPRSAEGKQILTLEPPGHYPVGTFTFVSDHELFIYRDHEGISALSAVCTHLGCMVRRTTGGFECPCHGSCYDDLGKVVSGPASRDISWFRVEIGAEGRVRVDRGQVVPPGEKCLTYRS